MATVQTAKVYTDSRTIQLVLEFLGETSQEVAPIQEESTPSAGRSERREVEDRIRSLDGAASAVVLRKTKSLLSIQPGSNYLERGPHKILVSVRHLLPDPDLLQQDGQSLEDYVQREQWDNWQKYSSLLSGLKECGIEVIVPPSVDRWLARRLPEALGEMFLLTSWIPVQDEKPFDMAYVGTMFRAKKSDESGSVMAGSVYVVKSRIRTLSANDNRLTTKVVLHSASKAKVLNYSDTLQDKFNETFEPFVNLHDIYKSSNLWKTWRKNQVARLQKRFDSLNLPMFRYAAEDVVEAALRDRVLFCNPPRMGKTSQMLAFALLKNARKVLVVCVKNGRDIFIKEAMRMGIPERDVVLVDRLEDLDKPGRFYLATYSWLRGDPARVKPQQRTQTLRLEWNVKDSWALASSEKETSSSRVYQFGLFGSFSRLYYRSGMKVGSARMVQRKNCQEPWPLKDVIYVRHKDSGKHKLYYPLLFTSTSCQFTVSRGAARPKKNAAGLPELYSSRFEYVLAGSLQHARVFCGDQGSLYLLSGDRFGNKPLSVLRKEIGETEHSLCRADIIRRKYKFDAILVDEIHHLRNWDTRQTQAVFNLRAKYQAGASGPLAVINPADVYNPLCWILDAPSSGFPYYPKAAVMKKMPGCKVSLEKNPARLYSKFADFEEAYIDSVVQETGAVKMNKKGMPVMQTKTVKTPFLKQPIEFWQKIRGPWIMRRHYDDPKVIESLKEAGLEIPAMRFYHEMLEPVPEQKALIAGTLQHINTEYKQLTKELDSNSLAEKSQMLAELRSKMLGYIRLLRLIATAPGMLKDFGVNYSGPFAGCKEQVILDRVMTWAMEGRKTLVLSDHPRLRAHLGGLLAPLNAIVFDTSWNDEKRTEAFESFNLDPDRMVMVCGPRSVNESVDLSIATAVLTVDLLWSPAPMIQSWSRVRTPKPEPVPVENRVLYTKGSIDLHIREVFYSRVFSMEQLLDHRVLSNQDMVFDMHKFMERVLSDLSIVSHWEVEKADEAVFERPVLESLNQIFLPDEDLAE